MSVMTNDPRLPGKHRCRLCGTTWSCNMIACGPQVNETLLCLRCDADKAESELSRAKGSLEEAERTGHMIETAKDRLQAATIRSDRLRGAVAEVYGGFSA